MAGLHKILILVILVGLGLAYVKSKEKKPVVVEEETTEEIVDGLLEDFENMAEEYGY